MQGTALLKGFHKETAGTSVLRLWLYRGEQLAPSTLVRCHGTSCSTFGGTFWAHSDNQTHYVYRIHLLSLNNSWTTQNMLDFQPGKLKCPQRVNPWKPFEVS